LLFNIGGYLDLELNSEDIKLHEFEPIKLQSCRAALYLYLQKVKCKKLYVPYYICGDLFDVFEKLNIDVKLYNIDNNLLPCIEEPLEVDRYLLLVNYFGIMTSKISEYLDKEGVKKNKIIIDNSQALFSPPNMDCAATVYSPRKFLGIPDGGFLYTNEKIEGNFSRFDSSSSVNHLFLRLSGRVQEGYFQFIDAEKELKKFEPKKQSLISEKLISNCNLEMIKAKRVDNFNYIKSKLHKFEAKNFQLQAGDIPLCYPFVLKDCIEGIWKYLISKGVFLPRYWSRSKDNPLYSNTLFLPLHQRLTRKEIDVMLDMVIKKVEEYE
jgi:hypothetical protein